MVSDEKQIYHCFGCGEGGDVFGFFMKFDGLSFRETIEMLAARAGVALPKLRPVDKDKEDALEKKKEWSYRLNQIVAEFFARNLADPQKGEEARNYLKSRDIFLEKNTQHFLGSADDSWDSLVRHLEERRVPLELAAELGVVKKREGGGYYDFFRQRIMFPVVVPCAGGTRVVAFSGRTFGSPRTAEGREEPAKYLNSPDSLIYHKSHTAFGLQAAAPAIRRDDLAIIVEGNLDVVRLHQEGITSAVAPLGTALTSGHVRLLARYSKNFVVVFDGDEAGQKAAQRSLPIFLEAGLVPKVVALPRGEDPDSFVRKNGAEALRKLTAGAPLLFEWLIDVTVERCGKGTDGKVKAVEELKPLFSQVRNAVEIASYRKRLASRLSLDEPVLAATLTGGKGRLAEVPAVARRADRTERTLLELMLTYPELIGTVRANAGPEQFSDGSHQTIARMIFDEFERSSELNVARMAAGIADEALKDEVLSLALAEGKYDDPKAAVKDCLEKIRRASARQRLGELTEAVQRVKGDDEKIAEYMVKIQKVTKELHTKKLL
jgi:DNA primase